MDVTLSVAPIARMVKLVDTRDLKSLGWKRLCRFDSGSGSGSGTSKSSGYRVFTRRFETANKDCVSTV